MPLDGRVEGGSDVIQAELDALAAEITQGLSYRKTNGQLLTPGTNYWLLIKSAFATTILIPRYQDVVEMSTSFDVAALLASLSPLAP